MLDGSRLTNASAKADSASRLCCRIFCAMTGRWGGRSVLMVWTDRPLCSQSTYHNKRHFTGLSA
jgi:hypothetical protein